MPGLQLTEFYPERQGRPGSMQSLDLEARTPSIPASAVSGVALASSYSTLEQDNSYTAAAYTVILCDCSGGNITITLPSALENGGTFYYIKKIDSSGNVVTIKGTIDTATIDGDKEIRLSLQHQYVQVLCDSIVWHIIGGEYVKMTDVLNSIAELQKHTLNELRLLNERYEETHETTIKMEEVNDN